MDLTSPLFEEGLIPARIVHRRNTAAVLQAEKKQPPQPAANVLFADVQDDPIDPTVPNANQHSDNQSDDGQPISTRSVIQTDSVVQINPVDDVLHDVAVQEPIDLSVATGGPLADNRSDNGQPKQNKENIPFEPPSTRSAVQALIPSTPIAPSKRYVVRRVFQSHQSDVPSCSRIDKQQINPAGSSNPQSIGIRQKRRFQSCFRSIRCNRNRIHSIWIQCQIWRPILLHMLNM